MSINLELTFLLCSYKAISYSTYKQDNKVTHKTTKRSTFDSIGIEILTPANNN